MGWIEFALALGAFMLFHRLPAALGAKGWLERRLGPTGYVIAFSVLSLGLLWWVILAAGRAPYVPLWDPAPWQRWAVNLALPLAIALGTLGVGSPNPFAFEGRATGYDPDAPGIAGITRQPLLWALALWSGAHLLANGDLAHVALFGLFALFSLAGMAMVERRRRRAMGPAEWARLTARTSLLPFAALLRGEVPGLGRGMIGRLALAAVIWAALWHLHAPLLGVSPRP